MEMPNAPSPLCLSCSKGEIDSLKHALLKCSTIRPATEFLLEALKSEIPDITLESIRYLDFQSEDLLAPTYLTEATLLAASKVISMWNANSLVLNLDF